MTDIYGPLPSPAEVTVSATYLAWTISLGVGCGLSYLGRFARLNSNLGLALFTLGTCVILTAPVTGLPENVMWGAYPTLDKQASLMFYANNAHWLPVNSFGSLKDHYPLMLIGIHICHMWVTEFFDLFLSTSQAINLHAVANLWLTVLFATLYVRTRLGSTSWPSIVAGLCFGLSLHQFREIQWYTIEKSGMYWVPLFLWQVELILKGGKVRYLPLICLAASLYNLYTTLIMAVYGLIYAVAKNNRALWVAIAMCGLVGALIGVSQYLIMSNGPTFATPEEFQIRASMDIVDLWPPLWNRLELWHLCSPIMLILVPCVFMKRKVKPIDLLIFLFFTFLSFGPVINGQITNPLYKTFQYVPGMWRMAKPEIYFTVPFLIMCLWTAEGIRQFKWEKYPKVLLALFGVLWILTTRLHPVYPQFTEYKPGVLDPKWKDNVFEAESTK